MNFALLDGSLIDCILAIEKECFGAEAWTQRMLEESLSSVNTFFWGAFDDKNNLVAYAAIIRAEEMCDLIKIAVMLDFRSKGIADALLKFVFSEIKKSGVKKMFLEVNVGNTSAINLYTKNGFTVLLTRPNYYSGVQYTCRDALTMMAEI